MTEHGRYRLQLERGPAIEVVSSPIWFESLPARRARAVATATTRTSDAADCKK